MIINIDKKVCNIDITTSSELTARIQELYLLIGHIIYEYFD